MGLLASKRHTAATVAVLLVIAAAGYVAFLWSGSDQTPSQGGGASLYASVLAAEVGLFYLVWRGLRAHGTGVGALITTRPNNVGSLVIDVILGALLVAVWLGCEQLLVGARAATNPTIVNHLLVRQRALIPLWIIVSISAGFVEELTFRGYLQRQFSALLGSWRLGVLVQAVLFGVTHGYQGSLLVARITVFGLIFGFAAKVRGSLIPVMVAHSALDVVGGMQLLHP